jgi:hypothetical protein
VLRDQQGTPLGMIRGGAGYAFTADDVGSKRTPRAIKRGSK